MTATIVLVAPTSSQSASHALSEAELRGRRIFLQGEGATGREILALLGDARTEVPAKALACAGCHGFDGRGRPEGGVSPSNVTWEALTKPYGLRHSSGREHGAYDERSVVRAITQGLDPAGNRLATVMPQYRLTHAEAADLVAYLRRVGDLRDPGLSDAAIRLGVVAPEGAEGDAIESLLKASFEEVNAQGGVHGRRLELLCARAGAGARERLGAYERLVRDAQVFALLASTVAGAEAEIARFLDAGGTPLVGALTADPLTADPLNRYVFYLFSGARTQAEALAQRTLATRRESGPRAAILRTSTPAFEGLARAIEERWSKADTAPLEAIEVLPAAFDADVVTAGLRAAGIDTVFLLVEETRQSDLLAAAARQSWAPRVLVPGAHAARDLLRTSTAFAGTIELALPFGPADPDAAGTREFLAFAARHEVELGEQLPSQVAAWCSTRLFVEALRRTGRELGREHLTRTLEGFYDFELGLAPPIRFGPNRRIGAQGAYVVTIEAQPGAPSPSSAWVPVD